MKSQNWVFDELEHAGTEHVSTEQVALYDQKAQVDPARDLQRFEVYGLAEDATLVDLGAGTGIFALEAAKRCGRVVAVDVSPAMLEVMRQKAEKAKLDNVEVVRAGFLTYEHEGAPADFVYSRNALHHLPDFWKMQALLRIPRFLKAGGVLRLRDLAYSFDPQEARSRVEAWLAAAPETAVEGVPRHEIEAHVRHEYSTYTWILEGMLERVGSEIMETKYSDSGIFAAYTCVLRGE
jgi:ubiquinone/menaquinone biosynthesis C-methylase UbiE